MSSVKTKKAGKAADAPNVIEQMLPLVPSGKCTIEGDLELSVFFFSRQEGQRIEESCQKV